MTNLSNTEQNSQYYYQFREEIIFPWLQEIWYLRIPAFVGVLSLIFFALVDQTLEAYRILYQQWSWQHLWSFMFLSVLSLSICYSGRTLSIVRIREEKDYLRDSLTDKEVKRFYTEDRDKILNLIKNKHKILILIKDVVINIWRLFKGLLASFTLNIKNKY